MENGVLGANKEYVQQTKEYGRKDALLSLVIYGIAFGSMFILRQVYLYKGEDNSSLSVFTSAGILSLSLIGIVILFCFLRRQKANTI